MGAFLRHRLQVCRSSHQAVKVGCLTWFFILIRKNRVLCLPIAADSGARYCNNLQQTRGDRLVNSQVIFVQNPV
ncbi:MAG: hypothetical protein CM1200mP18_03540 [Gammaproteobacteria bacterium]|nr:MAG: hypothetical protein CM1200mP18_03540 [Gammaproteobacteria bacterium]